MKFSIVTVVYNAVNTIERTIRSVISQHNDSIDVEYIVIDGGSTDGTVELIRQYSNQICFWVSEKDLGIYDAMNKGIKHCNGDFVMFLGADDYYVENALSIIVDTISKEDKKDIYCFNVYLNRDGQIEKRKQVFKETSDLRVNGMIYNHQGMVARKTLFNNSAFDIDYEISADYEWALKQYLKGVSFTYIPIEIAVYGLAGKSSTHVKLMNKENMEIALKYASDEEMKREIINRRKAYDYLLMYREANKKIANYVLESVIARLKGHRIAVMGAGEIGKCCISALESSGVTIELVVDNMMQKQGTYIYDHIIRKVDDLCTENIVVIASFVYYSEMKKQLLEYMGVPEKNVISFAEMIDENILNI